MAKIANFVCPPDCQHNHNEHKVTMAKIEQRLSNIETSQIEIKESIKDFIKALDKKADKEELNALKDEIKDERKKTISFKDTVLYVVITVLFTALGFMLKTYVFR